MTGEALIAAYLEHMRRKGATATTLVLRSKLLHRADEDLPYGVGEANTEELAKWLHRESLSRNSRATYYAGLKSFFDWACDPRDPWLTFNPALDLDHVSSVKGVARPCTDDELRRILTQAAEPYRTWAHLAAYQGLRCIEISRLDREHVTADTLNVLMGKGGKPRTHDTHPAVWDLIAPKPPGPIARLVRSGERANAAYISFRSAKHFTTHLGLEGVTMHRLRHWLGCTTQRLYKDIRVTQRMLGHESLQSTQIYTDATFDQTREARSMLPRFDVEGRPE